MAFYLNQYPVRSLLEPQARMHAFVDVTVGNLRIAVAELVRREVDWSPIKGYLLVHLEMATSRPEIASMAHLARVARPRYRESRELVAAVRDKTNGTDSTRSVHEVLRVFSASLSPEPEVRR